VSDLNFVGATPFAAVSESARLDVVFLHGITGDGVTTWSIGSVAETYWPRWLAEDHPSINVYSASYDSSLFTKALSGEGASIVDLATMQLDHLRTRSSPAPGVIFITHSLGGLIIKQMLRKCADSANPETKALLGCVKGIAFIGTPHQGAGAAKTLDVVMHKLLSKAAKQLAYGEEQLVDLSEWFRSWIGTSKVPILAYYETKKTNGVKVVDKITANPNVLGCDPIAIASDHIDICKPSSRQAQLYKSISKFVADASKRCDEESQSSQTAFPNKKALRQLSSEESTADFATEEMDPEILVDYQNFTTTSPDDRRTLAEKLEASGRRYEIRTAERAKERFNMALQRHIAQPSALARFTRLMSEVETRFNRHVRQAICSGESNQKVNRLVQREVIDPTMTSQTSEGVSVTASLVESALYYLTGNCHVRWENVQD
jgi:protein SERAC1